MLLEKYLFTLSSNYIADAEKRVNVEEKIRFYENLTVKYIHEKKMSLSLKTFSANTP